MDLQRRDYKVIQSVLGGISNDREIDEDKRRRERERERMERSSERKIKIQNTETEERCRKINKEKKRE